jgi:hypothetical protein
MKSIQKAQQELNTLKNDVIGIYKHRTLGVFELVLKINRDAETIETIFISQFGTIQRGFQVQYQQGILHLFPDNKNMNEMLNNPFEFDAFIKQFN